MGDYVKVKRKVYPNVKESEGAEAKYWRRYRHVRKSIEVRKGEADGG